ncbi:MAG: hypothetical protein ACC657_17455 [Thiohalomonadales bacterium]
MFRKNVKLHKVAFAIDTLCLILLPFVVKAELNSTSNTREKTIANI